jgi:diguanylate cyclase (GGDEF)-like protein/PAS domain S-box-containing protein
VAATKKGQTQVVEGFSDLTQVRRSWLERVLDVVRQLGTSEDLTATLQRIAAAIVDVVEFDAVALNVATGPDELQVAVVQGPPGVTKLLGSVITRSAWEQLFTVSERWGALYFSDRVDTPDRQVWTAEDIPVVPGVAPEERWLPHYELYAPLFDDDGALLGVLSVDLPRSGRIPDIEQRVVLELFAAQAATAIAEARRKEDARDQQAVYRSIFLAAPAAIAVLDDRMHIVEANDRFIELAGYPMEELAALSRQDLRNLVGSDALEAQAEAVLAGEEPDPTVHRFLRGDGVTRWARTSMRRVTTARFGPRVICTTDDVTDDQHTLEVQRHRAEHDPLTGLRNRRAGHAHLEVLLEQCPERAVAVLGCDLDGFKAVNDALGHLAGDELLVHVARRLVGAVRPSDVVCRPGGDEFLIFAAVDRVADASDMAARCVETVGRPFLLETGPVAVTISIGVAVTRTGGAAGARDVLASADRALYRAKDLGRDRWHWAGLPPVLPADQPA